MIDEKIALFILISLLLIVFGVCAWIDLSHHNGNEVSEENKTENDDTRSIIGYGSNGKLGVRLGNTPLQIDFDDGDVGITLFGL